MKDSSETAALSSLCVDQTYREELSRHESTAYANQLARMRANVQSGRRTPTLLLMSQQADKSMTSGSAVIELNLATPTQVAKYELYSGGTPEKRDPTAWTVERYNYGVWETVASPSAVVPPVSRGAIYGEYYVQAPPPVPPPPPPPNPPPDPPLPPGGPPPPPIWDAYQFVFTGIKGGTVAESPQLIQLAITLRFERFQTFLSTFKANFCFARGDEEPKADTQG